jgi:transcriptional regulator
MHTPAHFENCDLADLHAVIGQWPLATIVFVDAAAHLSAHHIPVLLDAEHGEFGGLRGHVARANPVWREVPSGSEVLAVFRAGDAYVSPTWYQPRGSGAAVVPTWNYVAVHATGRIRWHEERAWLESFLEQLTDAHERDRQPAWRMSDAPAGYLQKMIAGVVGFEIDIVRLEGKWKLSQNKSAQDRASIAATLRDSSAQSDRQIARLMDAAGARD